MGVVTAPLTERWTQLRPHAIQSRYYRSRSRFKAVVAGRRSGKTEIARRKVIRWLQIQKPWPDPMYFYALPTRDQAKRVAWPALKALVPDWWLAPNGVSESELSITTIYGSKLWVLGLDKPARAEGVGWDGGVVDESCDQKPGAYDRTLRPALSDRNGWCDRIGVPKRSGPGAQEFKQFYLKGIAGESDIESFTWPSWDILPRSEIDAARGELDPKDFNEQYGASWETVGGQVFYAFDAANVSEEPCYREDLPLLIGCDFNVDPMAWVVAHEVAPKQLDIFDELFLRNTNTAASLVWLAKKYGRHPHEVKFYGDATGKARKTSASESDYVQIRNSALFVSGATRVFFPLSNPPVQDRFAATNAMLCSASGVRRLRINKRCRNLIRDLEQRAYKPGSTEPDDHDDVGHITDALGYMVFQTCPLRLALGHSSPEVSAV